MFSGLIFSSIKSEYLSFLSNFKIKPSVIPFFLIDSTKISLISSLISAFTYFPIDKREVVRDIANFLPNIDLIGHQVLLANKDLIPIIYDMDNIPYDLKKDIILGIIKLSQYGDSFGGILLNNYHHFVDIIL